MPRIILDTDIGTNADDAVALALAVKSPEIRLEGVTTVYGQVQARAVIADKIMRLCGVEGIPVYPGIEQPLLRNRPMFRAGLERKGWSPDDEEKEWDKHAVDFIVETVMRNPGEITLVTIGPQTNIAAALIREPRLSERVKEIVVMGGVTRLASNGLHLSALEFNIQCDPEAASVVFASGAPIVMVGLDVTRQAVFSREEKDKMAACGTPLALELTDMMQSFMDYMDRDFSYMCDPLAVAAVIDRSFIRTRRMNVSVHYDHREDSGQTIAELSDNGNVEVALEVDTERYFRMLHSRLFTACS
ncbi:nucleoside hydrolase [Paenibacillus beijingensis]|uniref:Nucleoside hydrolase n=1 Tax=Paenibacillus beijingensis TaxID=1126833 RepID=A0A0D5NS08_9BACL|nr:nucleoside hydrolase [Paenibacillus beijingensis]